MTTLEKILLVLIVIGLVGLIIYFFFKDQIEAWFKGGSGSGGGGGGGGGGSTTPPSITLDKTTYNVGESIKWSASNLVVGKTYVVGALKSGNVYWSGARDKFTATSTSKSGEYFVGDNLVGNIQFGLFDENLYPIDLKNITVKSTIQPLYPLEPYPPYLFFI
jgi:hypothetical protein